MEVLNEEKLDQVSGGAYWVAGLAFVYLNLEKISDSLRGFRDGFEAGFMGQEMPAAEPVCRP